MLPIKEDIYSTIQVNGETVEIKAWKTKDEKRYLIAKETNGFNEETLYDVLVKPSVKNYDKYNFTDNENLYIITKIREISIGSDIEISFTCPECKQYQDIELDLNEIVKYKPANYRDVKIDDYIFKFKKGNFKKIKERTKDKNNVEADFIALTASIYEIQIDGKVYDTFTFDELYNFLDNLDTRIFTKLYEEYYTMVDSISFNYECKCQVCGAQIKDTLDSIPNFLWD